MGSRLFLLLGLTTLLLPAEGLAQFRFGGDSRGPGGDSRSRSDSRSRGDGRSSMSSDPLERWNQRTGGRDVWARAEITDPMQQRIFDMIAQQIGATNGVITRDQYLTFSQQRMSSGGSRSGGSRDGDRSSSRDGDRSSSRDSFNPDQFADGMFRRQDQNGDGLLNYDEMPESLRIERDKWDANRDGFVDLAEFKAHFQGLMMQRREERGGYGMPAETPAEEERKPVVYRAGNLPKDIPSWFPQLDKDTDGQVGLYEWRASNRPLDEFRGMDRNGDGFLVVEEVMRSQNAPKDRGPSTDARTLAGTIMPSAPQGSSRGGPPPWGGMSRSGGMSPGSSRGFASWGPPPGMSSSSRDRGKSSRSGDRP